MSKSQITTNNEDEFLKVLENLILSGCKLIFAAPIGNRFNVSAEIRFMPVTGGGFQYGLARINYMNQRGGGMYSSDPERIYLWAIDVEKENRSSSWWFVRDCEHTPSVDYFDAIDHLPV